MNISYDFFIEHPEAIEEVSKSFELDTFFRELLLFVAERLKPLETEILAEEIAGGEEDFKATIIYILRTDNKFINFCNYSDNLTAKMLSCFSKNDFDFIIQKIQGINYARNN